MTNATEGKFFIKFLARVVDPIHMSENEVLVLERKYFLHFINGMSLNLDNYYLGAKHHTVFC